MIVVHDGMDHTLQPRMRQRLGIGFPDVPVDSNPRRQPGRKMQIGSVTLNRVGEQPRDILGGGLMGVRRRSVGDRLGMVR